MLRSRDPKALLWGADAIFLHNDSYVLISDGLRPELIGGRAFELWPDHAPFLREVLTRGLAGEAVSFRGLPFPVTRRGAAETIHLDLDYVPVPDEEGRAAGLLASISDAALPVTGEADEGTARTVQAPGGANSAPERDDRLGSLIRIAGGFAHDFNNLLTPVVAGLDIVRRRVPDERSQRLISGALQSSERAAGLVQRLLAFAGKQRLNPRPMSPTGVLEGLSDLMRPVLRPEVELRMDVPPDLPAVMADPEQIEVALLNLVANAQDAMPAGGRLTISAELVDTEDDPVPGLRPGQYVSLAVSDTGQGMEADTLRQAVEPFFTTKQAGQGTGLGLSMVHGFAAQSGGMFRLLSEQGRGTAAVLFLPVATSEARPADAGGEGVHRAIVLLVDDEDLVRLAMAEGLRELGYDVEEVSSASEALEAIAAGFRPDILITDHMMPGMKGSDLAREVSQRLPGLPILMVTGFAQLPPEETRGINVMGKPFRQADLASRLALMLDPTRRNVVPLYLTSPLPGKGH
jgi:signal transduction histidine kinase/CheY-like chemotaxis protein